jgi:ribosomal protein L23
MGRIPKSLFSKIRNKPADWVAPWEPPNKRKQIFLYVWLPTTQSQSREGNEAEQKRRERERERERKLTIQLTKSPDFTIALIHTPSLPPRFASFYVPLSFNKLDIRDYLKRAYGVHTIRVRSFVQQEKITRAKRFGKPGFGPLRRPISKKKMTVEMTEPFVWPDLPEDMSPYVSPGFTCGLGWVV